MARLLFARGARGELIRVIQQKLAAIGHHDDAIDGIYGNDTTASVKSFQQARNLPVTGDVDVDTWTALTGQPVPPVENRCLDLTATFEGHGFTLAQGNFDGAGITWGIIGFTLQHGELTTILKSAFAQEPDTVRACSAAVTTST